MSAPSDIERAASWARDFAARFPELEEAYIVGSRAAKGADPESDFDVVLVIRGGGTLSLSNYSTIPSDEPRWGWLQPEDAAKLRFAPDATCDIMLVDAEAAQDVGGLTLDEPFELLWKRRPTT